MAAFAALIPIIEAAAPLLTPLIKGAATHLEHLFGAKTGPAKFDALLNMILPLAEKLSTAGQIPGQLDPALLAGLIQPIVTDMKSKGELTPESAAAAIQSAGPAGVGGMAGSAKGGLGAAVGAGQTIKITGGSLVLAGGATGPA